LFSHRNGIPSGGVKKGTVLFFKKIEPSPFTVREDSDVGYNAVSNWLIKKVRKTTVDGHARFLG
jgi:hypothetical protein